MHECEGSRAAIVKVLQLVQTWLIGFPFPLDTILLYSLVVRYQEKKTGVKISPSLERSQCMEEDATLVTHEQYIEMLIDASFRDASEMESGFTSWCQRHVPTWRKLGYDETWIRQVRRFGAC
jgi:hypothetical protein